MTTGRLVLFSLLLSSSAMMLVWLLALRMRNNSIVDIAWSTLFSILAVLYALLGYGYPMRRVVIAGMVSLWSLRLAFHLYHRISNLHPEEEGRYVQLRLDWAGRIKMKSFCFFQLQGLLSTALSLPFLLVSLNQKPEISVLEILGLSLWFSALIGEVIADRQLHRFKENPQNKGKVCQQGLWHYSRHPNYFFEWLVWVSYFVFASGAPYGMLTVYCPLLMLYFLLRVTGIPMTEEQAIRTKGDAYREYQRTTSAFFPWFRRETC